MNSFLDLTFKFFESVGPVIVGFGGIILSKKLDKQQQDKKLNLDEDYKKKNEILPILDSLRLSLEADRVFEMVFSNGDVTLTGHHLKKLSVFLESNNEGFKDLGKDIQLVPTKIFERSLDELYNSEDDYILTNEFQKFDDLASLYAQYEIQKLLLVKIKNNIGKWVGILCISFDKDRNITDGEIAFAKMQAARLGLVK